MTSRMVQDLPVALAAASLLCLGWVGIGMAGFGKVLGKSRFTLSSAIGNAGVVAVSELVGASHCIMVSVWYSTRLTGALNILMGAHGLNDTRWAMRTEAAKSCTYCLVQSQLSQVWV